MSYSLFPLFLFSIMNDMMDDDDFHDAGFPIIEILIANDMMVSTARVLCGIRLQVVSLPSMITDVVPSPTSSSCVLAISIIDLAAGCSTVIYRATKSSNNAQFT